MEIQKENIQVLFCPFDFFQVLQIPYVCKDGKSIITSPRAVHMLKQGLIVRVNGANFVPEDSSLLLADNALPDFGYSISQYIWVSHQCVANNGKLRVLEAIPLWLLGRWRQSKTNGIL